MNRRTLAWGLLIAWTLVFLGSTLALFLFPSTERTLDSGLARISTFFGWQLLAGFLALPTWWAGRSFDRGTAGRWMTRLPPSLTLFLILAGATMILYMNRKPVPQDPGPLSPKTVTAPMLDQPTTTDETRPTP